MKTDTKTTIRQYVAVAVLLSMATVPAFADVIGAQQVSDDVLTSIRVIAILGIAWGFIRLMSGRHTLEGLMTVAIGAAGVGKTQAIAGLVGL